MSTPFLAVEGLFLGFAAMRHLSSQRARRPAVAEVAPAPEAEPIRQ